MPPLPDGKIYSATYSNVSLSRLPFAPASSPPSCANACLGGGALHMGGKQQSRLTKHQVPVYEFNVAGNHVMRRRADDWINATHILKVADYDKPARTRILEREVQKGVHEKVQGGYGKYQGTWIPLPEGRQLAERNGVLEKMLPIFDFIPGDRSPPPAPKHATAASNRPKPPRQSAAAVSRNGNNKYSLESIQCRRPPSTVHFSFRAGADVWVQPS